MYAQKKLKIKCKYTKAIEESQNDNNANDGSRPLLIKRLIWRRNFTHLPKGP